MAEYKVTWEIDIEADSVEEAAQQALEMQRDPAGTATVFEVQEHGKETVTQVDIDPY